MSGLLPFTAVAATMVRVPWIYSTFEWSRQPTAMGFLSYGLDGSDRAVFDLAIRIRTYGEGSSLLARWTTLNVPPGVCVGWDLRTDRAWPISSMRDLPLGALCRKSRGAGLISLKKAASYGHDFVMGCAAAGIGCDMRDPVEKFDDYYTSSHERAFAGIVLDTVATFILAMDASLGELRGGAQLRREIEMQMVAGFGSMIRQAVSDVPVLSHLLKAPSSTDGMVPVVTIDPSRLGGSVLVAPTE